MSAVQFKLKMEVDKLDNGKVRLAMVFEPGPPFGKIKEFDSEDELFAYVRRQLGLYQTTFTCLADKRPATS